MFSIDFHSTYEDIYYTVDPKKQDLLPGLIPSWIAETAVSLPDYKPHVKPLYFEPPTCSVICTKPTVPPPWYTR